MCRRRLCWQNGSMAVVPTERLSDYLDTLGRRDASVPDYCRAATRTLARAVPFDGFCVLTMDPATLVPTGEVVENGLPRDTSARMSEIELRGEDFNTFTALGRSGRRAASLSQATGGDLDRSVRHRELRAPNGFGDELRAVLVRDGTAWGALTLLRGGDHDFFTREEAAVVGTLSTNIAEGLRRAILLRALDAEQPADSGSAGLALLAGDNTITRSDPTAERWLAELSEAARGQTVAPVVAAVAERARSIARRGAEDGVIARARVHTGSGSWLLVRASTLGEDAGAQTAVVIEPAGPHDLAPLIADAYGLTARERTVTQLVAQGRPTNFIAERLHLSPWTVQDHLKAIFEKVGVATRGELVARMFFDHYAPHLGNDAPPRWD
jgi:DNA-binding CsgD family transcriptional regulator